ncbi:MAG TPA: phosphodiester glycosidase family protein [Candidatus Saccharimonadia bacterium]|nr:phosphodiester glycosidase family protein [Candidatus Saccharimonadia bacterium]
MHSNGDAGQLTLVFFDETKCKLQISANTSKENARPMDAMAADAGAIAACNGGYFDPPKMLPTGLEIANGTRTGTLDPTLPFGGMVVIEKEKASIITTEEFTDRPETTGLLQCCPRLVEGGSPIPKIGGEEPAARTFVMTDGKGRWAIGISKSIGLPDLANILCNSQIIPEFRVHRALNLDGGPSTTLWCKDDTGAVTYAREKWKVRNVILVVPRRKSAP